MLNPTVAATTIKDLHDIPLRRPERAGSDWKGVPHAELVVALMAEVRRRDWTPRNFASHVSRLGADLVASFEVHGSAEATPLRAFGVAVSNDGRRQLRFFVGAVEPAEPHTSYVLDSFPAGKRYVLGFSLEREVEEAVDRWHGADGMTTRRLHRLDRRVSHEQVGRWVLAAQDRAVLTAEQAKAVMQSCWDQEPLTARFVLRRIGQAVGEQTPTTALDRLLTAYRMVSGTPEPVSRQEAQQVA